MLGPKLNKYSLSNFHLLEVVGRGSETRLQMGENLNYWIYLYKGYYEIRVWSVCVGQHFNIVDRTPWV